MSQESWEQFRQLVLRDTNLQERLRETPDRKIFLALVVQLGEEQGYNFTTEDVETALQASRRAWLERWI